MSANYPFTKCLKPRRIINPYTNESLVVSCGKCPACLLRKSSLNALKCKLESLAHKYTMFVTLTYNNGSLPVMHVVYANKQKDDCGEVYDTYEHPILVDYTPRLGTEGTVLGKCLNTYILESLSKKVERPLNILPHLSKYDVQLFIKRLRINLERIIQKKYGKQAEKIRYYLVGEYGPVHFRPHYHLELWFDEDETFEVIRQAVSKSWSFGRIDIQKSLGQSADYVAKYLNSSVSLPKVFKEFGTAPFAMHSTHLGEKVLEVEREAVLKNEYSRIVSKRINSINADTDVFLWRSLKSFYFPKCKGYSQKSEFERLFSYSTYVAARKWTKKDRISDQARIILEIILSWMFHCSINLPFNIDDLDEDDYDDIDEDYKFLIEYFIVSACIEPLHIIDTDNFSENINRYYQRIYMELRVSQHFHNFVCSGDLSLYEKQMNAIEEFWKFCDLENLKNQYRQMEDFAVSEFFENEEDFQYFYHNKGFEQELFKKTKAYKLYNHMTLKNSEYAVKHKKLNDLNKVFENK